MRTAPETFRKSSEGKRRKPETVFKIHHGGARSLRLSQNVWQACAEPETVVEFMVWVVVEPETVVEFMVWVVAKPETVANCIVKSW